MRFDLLLAREEGIMVDEVIGNDGIVSGPVCCDDDDASTVEDGFDRSLRHDEANDLDGFTSSSAGDALSKPEMADKPTSPPSFFTKAIRT